MTCITFVFQAAVRFKPCMRRRLQAPQDLTLTWFSLCLSQLPQQPLGSKFHAILDMSVFRRNVSSCDYVGSIAEQNAQIGLIACGERSF